MSELKIQYDWRYVVKNKNLLVIIILNGLLMIYSLNSIFSKLAAGEPEFSFKWCLYYGMVLFLLGIYAIGWQQIIKRLPLTLAFSNKAVTVIWGIIWGALFFKERITAGKIIGAIIIIAGVVLFAFSDDKEVADE